MSEVVWPDDALSALAENMLETMRAHEGVGLAASQVGLDRRMIVLDAGPLSDPPYSNPTVMINPEITHSGGQAVFREGCLSFPDVYVDVKRPEWISVRYFDTKGLPLSAEYRGVAARIIQHEIDHLDGILFIDRVSPIRRWFLRKKLKELQKHSLQILPEKGKGIQV